MADSDIIEVPYDCFVQRTISGREVVLWWEQDPTRSRRSLYAQCESQREHLISVAESYVARDPSHRYRVTEGMVKSTLREQFPLPMTTYIQPNRPMYFYGPAWGSVTAGAVGAIAAEWDDSGLHPTKRQRKPQAPEPEPTLRPTGGRRFDLDDD